MQIQCNFVHKVHTGDAEPNAWSSAPRRVHFVLVLASAYRICWFFPLSREPVNNFCKSTLSLFSSMFEVVSRIRYKVGDSKRVHLPVGGIASVQRSCDGFNGIYTTARWENMKYPRIETSSFDAIESNLSVVELVAMNAPFTRLHCSTLALRTTTDGE